MLKNVVILLLSCVLSFGVGIAARDNCPKFKKQPADCLKNCCEQKKECCTLPKEQRDKKLKQQYASVKMEHVVVVQEQHVVVISKVTTVVNAQNVQIKELVIALVVDALTEKFVSVLIVLATQNTAFVPVVGN